MEIRDANSLSSLVPKKMMKRTILIGITLLLLAGCTAESEPGTLEITQVWGRPMPAEMENGAFYMQLSNGTDTDEQLWAVSADICGQMQIHQTTMQDGVMSMAEVENGRLDIPAGETVTLEPGGLHIMCLNKSWALAEGETMALRLQFAQAGEVAVTAVIQNAPPSE